jgi:hypothetical protein
MITGRKSALGVAAMLFSVGAIAQQAPPGAGITVLLGSASARALAGPDGRWTDFSRFQNFFIFRTKTALVAGGTLRAYFTNSVVRRRSKEEQ